MKKIIALIAAGLLVCGALAGCGGSKESSSDAKTETTVAATEAAKTEAETVVATDAADADATEAGEEAAFDYVGTWVVVKFITSDGKEYGLTDYAAAANISETDATITYSFTEDGKAVCTAGTVGVEGTYTVNGNEIQTTFTGSAPKLVYDEETGELCLQDENTGVTTYYAKMN